MFKKSITLKILIMTLVIILVGTGLMSIYFLNAQNRDLLNERELGIGQQAGVLFESIKNNMLLGTAPIARGLLYDLKNVSSIREIALFRANGKEAFRDNETIQAVNRKMGKEYFAPAEEYAEEYGTEEVIAHTEPLLDTSEWFSNAIHTQQSQFQTRVTENVRELVYYVPLPNAEECQRCHAPELSPNPDIRGVIRVNTPLDDVDRKLRQNTVASAVIWAFMVAALTLAVNQSMRRLVLTPLKSIGEVAGQVQQGDFTVQVPVRSEDEIGILGQQINRMIIGLDERLKLTKFVSKATLEEISAGGALTLGGDKRELTVLFSDIRGFTAFAEKHDPHEVMTTLNTYMQRQAAVILNAGGDVDQFVGDEILGVFSAETMAEDAVRAAANIVATIDDLNRAQGLSIHVGIGIHTGPMIVGNIGAQGAVERLQRTVIGDAVNLGARICSVAGPGEILVSQETYRHLAGKMPFAEPRTVKVKGKSEPVIVYPLLPDEPARDS